MVQAITKNMFLPGIMSYQIQNCFLKMKCPFWIWSKEISVCKGQNQYWTEWSNEHFQKPHPLWTQLIAVSTNNSWNSTMQRGKPHINQIQKSIHLLCAFKMNWGEVGRLSSDLTSLNSKFCLEIWAKEEGDRPACYRHTLQKPASVTV